MSDKQALQVVDQQVVTFYEDKITVVVVQIGEQEEIFVPIRPLCELLGIDWAGQRRRILRDPVLTKHLKGVDVMTTPSEEGRGGGMQIMSCLPLDYLNGWLFGISADRVKSEIRDRVIRYQEECYRVLAGAFLKRPIPDESSSTMSTLVQVREMGRAIMQMAEEQMQFEQRLTVTESRLDKAATVVGDLTKRVTLVEQRLMPGGPITEEQASQISQAVKTIALASPEKNFGAVYGELYRRFGITSYKLLPANRFDEAMRFLTEWYNSLVEK